MIENQPFLGNVFNLFRHNWISDAYFDFQFATHRFATIH